MKLTIFSSLALVLFVSTVSCKQPPNLGWFDLSNSQNGGAECAACTIVVSLVEQVSVINEKSVEQLLDEVCGWLPIEISPICSYFVNTYGDVLIELLASGIGPDMACHKLNFCTDLTCNLFSETKFSWKPIVENNRPKNYFRVNTKNLLLKSSPWDWIMALINRLTESHEPIVDVDGDLYSTINTLRGANWRGKDCRDTNAHVHPGAVEGNDPHVDWNCNGIYGLDTQGNSYEETLCGSSQRMGVAVLGDSAGAHFSIPPSYMNASEINKSTYQNLFSVLEDEFDWPQRSGYTGYEPSTPEIPIASFYSKMFNRNHCNHRDYQNVAVNGARSGAMASNIVKSLARNQTTDYPLVVFLELIGNDVCSPHETLDTMTTVQQFTENTLDTLNYLDTVLPKGSHVITVGLADGRVLWDSLHNRTHPIGATYAEVYGFLNCLGINPCWVWMNSNETIRNAGSQRAAELSAVYSQIIQNYKFKNFDMLYYDFPFKQIIKIWEQQGGEAWQLIEPIDGFHPNQMANYLTANWFWTTLSSTHPEIVGPVNPNNAQIEKIFGDQQGY